MTTTYTAEQREIIDHILNRPEHLLVEAFAGTGKTATVVAALHALQQKCRAAPAVGRRGSRYPRVLLTTYGKKATADLKERCRDLPFVDVRSLNGCGFQSVLSQWEGRARLAGKKFTIDKNRGARLAAEAAGADAPDEMVTLVRKLATWGKNCLEPKEICPEGESPENEAAIVESLTQLAEDFDCAPPPAWEDDGWTISRVVRCAIKALRAAMRYDGTIDFDDQVFLGVFNKFARPGYDLVIVDECQDMCLTNLRLAMRLCKLREGGRVVAIGDSHQAIFSFRGADSRAMQRIRESLKARTLKLTVTWRCATAIVEEARKLVPGYRAAPGAKTGEVRSGVTEREMVAQLRPGDAILSRTNAPLARICMSLLRRGQRAYIEGRGGADYIEQCVAQCKARSWGKFADSVEDWRAVEKAKLGTKSPARREQHEERIDDTADTVLELSAGCKSVQDLRDRVAKLFDEGAPGAVVLSSIHRAKGLEWPTVYVLADTLYSKSKTADIEEEENLHYVAVTRAMLALIYVEDEKRKQRARN